MLEGRTQDVTSESRANRIGIECETDESAAGILAQDAGLVLASRTK